MPAAVGVAMVTVVSLPLTLFLCVYVSVHAHSETNADTNCDSVDRISSVARKMPQLFIDNNAAAAGTGVGESDEALAWNCGAQTAENPFGIRVCVDFFRGLCAHANAAAWVVSIMSARSPLAAVLLAISLM